MLENLIFVGRVAPAAPRRVSSADLKARVQRAQPSLFGVCTILVNRQNLACLLIAGFFAMGVLTTVSTLAQEQEIRVVAGTYGGNCQAPHGNKTEHLAAACNGRTDCTYKIDYTVIGDPAVGCGKDPFRVGNLTESTASRGRCPRLLYRALSGRKIIAVAFIGEFESPCGEYRMAARRLYGR